VVALNDVGRINNFTDLCRVFKKGCEFIPVVSPGTYNEGIFTTPGFFKTVQFQQCHLLIYGFVNGL
jgi:hypothetical protein